jgi:UDPglucose--hexose-1-phosphate uridylyltransferase
MKTARQPESSERAGVRKTSVRLADGRELIYFGATPERPADYPDLRELPRVEVSPQLRYDPLADEWVVVASHRRQRTLLPGDAGCPLCPSTRARRTEVPAPAYDVVVFENRFPALGGAAGRCEVIGFSPDHQASFADLSPGHAAIVVEAWIDRTAELSLLPGVQQVYCFENRGREIGATLSHPHGQIYAYPFVTPRTSRMLSACAAYRQRTGRNLFDQVLGAELADGSRIVAAGEHWVAFVPRATRWACEVQLYPVRRVPDLAALPEAARAEFCRLYLDLLRRFDRLYDAPAPYIAAVHQAPVRQGREEFALHVELFSLRRGPGGLQYLAGSELGMGVFATDVVAESAAERLRQLG